MEWLPEDNLSEFQEALNGILTHEQEFRIFEQFLDTYQESNAFPTVDDAVVITQREVHHGAHHNLSIDYDGAFLDLVHPQDGRLRDVDDGCAQQ